ncbi:MAG: ribosomal protein S18-alanine N-acetyltransferase [Lachnospiraceae bacterium]|nr:ribosomal protein S18-alanine N-acetyltransferase [Lachnospiraceae bacterium]
MTIDDLDIVSAIEKECFSVPWSRDSFEGSLMQDNYVLVVATDDNDEKDILGYCCFYHVLDEAEIANVCIRPDARKQGLGYSMMRSVVDIAKELGVSTMYLEVRESNAAAQALYKKLGFFENGRRKGFYELPHEDALVMRYNINA